TGIAGLVTGTNSLRGAINGIINDIANIYVRKFISKKEQNGTGLFGFLGRLIGLPVGVKHSGGLVGEPGPTRLVDPAIFAGAPRFHSGGIVKGLSAGEVPIIARANEGVFTPEQMKALGGMGGVQINAPITVNATG